MHAVNSALELVYLKGPIPSVQACDHPLDPLSAAELQECVNIVRQDIPLGDTADTPRLWFKGLQLIEPSKRVLAPYLDKWHAAVEHGERMTPLPRQASVLFGVKQSGHTEWFDYKITLSSGDGNSGKVDSRQAVPKGQHVPADGEEMDRAAEALLNDPQFKAVIAKLQLPERATVVADSWIYGADSVDESPRFISFMVYMRMIDDADSCHYSYPLPLIPVVLADSFILHEIAFTPIMGGDSIKTVQDLDQPFPWEHYMPSEYSQKLREDAGENYRQDLKPYHVSQPEGASFTLNGRIVRWQKWTFHIGFNYREGTVISDVRYDGRKVFYRLSISDMTVPYGDPRAPFHRKQAFDLGGAGLTANELQLGCDCLGEIHYLDFEHVTASGAAKSLKGTVCIHEQDEGIGWKHTNYRTNNPSVTRSRVLVVQSMITVANYEYIFAWKFDQSANVTIETRATGILSTVAIMPGEKSPYGTIVSPGVLATNHQHLFSVRIDPSIDGHRNTVIQEDSVPMPFDRTSPPSNNLYGVGYTVQKTPILKSGWADAAPEKNRVFKIINPSKINPISGRPIGYKLVPQPSQLMLAHPDSIAYKRAEFGDHHIWVTKHKDDELYSGGLYTNQSNGNAQGIKSWVERKDDVENDDVVIWHTFGMTHNPRVEDFPVMPCEVHMVTLKPVDFFTSSPSNDVPASTQRFNRSRLYAGSSSTAGSHGQGDAAIEAEAKSNGLGKGCCA